VLGQFTSQLAASENLTDQQVAVAVEQLIDEAVPAPTKAEFLMHLARKGETIDEITEFTRQLRARAIEAPLDAETRSREILDVVGTGGDQLGTFNISTTAAILCATAGVTVAKHGNRAATSRCGSADVLESLGVRIHLTPEEAARSLKEDGFAFFFAPDYHPAFKHVAQARRLCAERGQRTIFNFLGPLLNPARPSALLVGVPRPGLCEPLARVLQLLGARRAMVVCGRVAPLRKFPPIEFEPTNHLQNVRVIDRDGGSHLLSISAALSLAEQKRAALVEIAPRANPPVCGLVDFSDLERVGNDDSQEVRSLDELSTLGDNTVAEFYQEHGFATSVLSPEQFPVQFASLADLLGGDPETNAQIVRVLLAGEDRGPRREAVLLNAGAALLVAGRARSIAEGWELAADLIDSGQAARKLRQLTSH